MNAYDDEAASRAAAAELDEGADLGDAQVRA